MLVYNYFQMVCLSILCTEIILTYEFRPITLVTSVRLQVQICREQLN